MSGKGQWKKRIRRWRVLVILVLVLFMVEVSLRVVLGFCDTVLLREDPHYEYIAQRDQERMRFGNRIRYNTLSMRSEEPDSAAIILLGCGDSVINGGVLTDQDSLATTLVSKELTAHLGRNVQLLNISAGSWGPDNCAAYLAHTELPRPRALLLFASSHDAHDNMSFKKVVGVNPSFPDEQYALALAELVDRYVLPRIFKPQRTDADLGIDKGGDGFNRGFAALKAYADSAGIPMVIYLHADQAEIQKGMYGAQGEEIIRFAEAEGLHLIKDLEHGITVEHLRDRIHPNDAGQRKMAEIVLADILTSSSRYALDH